MLIPCPDLVSAVDAAADFAVDAVADGAEPAAVVTAQKEMGAHLCRHKIHISNHISVLHLSARINQKAGASKP